MFYKYIYSFRVFDFVVSMFCLSIYRWRPALHSTTCIKNSINKGFEKIEEENAKIFLKRFEFPQKKKDFV